MNYVIIYLNLEVEGEELSRIKSQERKVLEDFGPTKIGKIRKYLWNLTEYPETSRAAQVAYNTIITFIRLLIVRYFLYYYGNRIITTIFLLMKLDS